jgi:hypothetical protein
MGVHMRVAGRITICTAKELTHGVMEENTKVNTIWIKNMVTEYIFGLMAGGMKDIGKMGNNMVKENIL